MQMILLDNQTDYDINLQFLDKIANYLKVNRDIELLIVDSKTIKSINYEYRGVDKVTDVLSFPLESVANIPLGSIIISIDKAKEISSKLKHKVDDEIALLFIHGLLHLLGYDHEIDNGQMREKESETIKEFKLPSSLIIRSEGE